MASNDNTQTVGDGSEILNSSKDASSAKNESAIEEPEHNTKKEKTEMIAPVESMLASSKDYPKRERKRRTWDGFETDLTDSKILMDKKQDGKVQTSTPKGRGRPPKLKPLTPESVIKSTEGKKRGRPFKSPGRSPENRGTASEDSGNTAEVEECSDKLAKGDDKGLIHANTTADGTDTEISIQCEKNEDEEGEMDIKSGENEIKNVDVDGKNDKTDNEVAHDKVDTDGAEVKMKPGRPSKRVTESEIGHEDGTNDKQEPKKRGRPPKCAIMNDSNNESEKSTLKSPGRPLKALTEKSPHLPKKRGRPFKNADSSKVNISKDENKDTSGRGETTNKDEPKRRGRPPKCATVNDSHDETETSTHNTPGRPPKTLSEESPRMPKKRGRPFKNANSSKVNISVDGHNETFDKDEGIDTSKVESDNVPVSDGVTSVTGDQESGPARIGPRKGETHISKLVNQMRNGERSVMKKGPGRPPKKKLEVDDDGLENSNAGADTDVSTIDNPNDDKEMSQTEKVTKAKRKGQAQKHLNNSNLSLAEVVDNDIAEVTGEHRGTGDVTTVTDSAADFKPRRIGRPPKGNPDNMNASLRRTKLDDSYVSEDDDPEKPDEVNDSEVTHGVDTAGKPRRKRGRQPKILQETVEDSTGAAGSRGTPGRKRKKINYSVLDGGSDDDGEDDDDNDDDNADDETPRRQATKRRRRNDSKDEVVEVKPRVRLNKPEVPKKVQAPETYQCVHCSYNGPSIIKHMACEHQRLWTQKNPAGGDSRAELNVVFRYKKFLNCPQCKKQVNQLFYYFNHLEWCGREDETFACDRCGKCGLKARWRNIHERECTALRVISESDNDEKEEEGEEDKELGRGHKRSAARKALSMVSKLSKDTEATAYSDDSNDPDVDLNKEEEDEDSGDDEMDEKEDLKEGDIADPGRKLIMRSNKGYSSSQAPGKLLEYTRYMFTFEDMMDHASLHMSDTLFTNWLPRKQDSTILSPGESRPYLPNPAERSLEFRFRNKKREESLQSLGLYESISSHGYPLLYTGLCIWRLAWCPMPADCEDVQYLAIVGRTDRSKRMSTHENFRGPGCIQVWKVGNCHGATCFTPSISYTIAHDYGMPTGLQWCPSGCYLPTNEQTDLYPRLGLLAVSFTDASVRIFSLPLLSEEESKDAPTFKDKPVLTLLPYKSVAKSNTLTCSCLDWCWADGHKKVMAGYSDGTVRLFNLTATAPALFTDEGHTLLPWRSFQAHGRIVRSVSWCGMLEDVVGTGSEDFELTYWDLNNTEFPISGESVSWYTINMAKSLWFHGLFVTSDDNYAIHTNRTRYLEPLGLMYTHMLRARKDEIIQYIILAQPACVWDISYTNWLNYLVTCDNRGYILGKPMVDLMIHTPDTKQYRHRLCLFKTTIHQKQPATEKCTCDREKSEACQICENNQSGNCLSDTKESSQSANCKNSSSNQSDQCFAEEDQSKHLLQNESETSSQSACKESEEPQTKHDTSVTTQSAQKLTGDTNTCETMTSDTKEMKSSSGNSQSSCANSSDSGNRNFFFEFEDHLQVPMCGLDTERNTDQWEEESIAALKSIAFNPNALHCQWLAFGGDAGFVRIVNIQSLLPLQFKHYYRKLKKKK